MMCEVEFTHHNFSTRAPLAPKVSRLRERPINAGAFRNLRTPSLTNFLYLHVETFTYH
jgi:hypothetical protein